MRSGEDTDSPEIAMAKPRAQLHPDGGTAMTMRARSVSTNTELILKIATALLITFAATLVLVSAEIYFSDTEIMKTHIDGLSPTRGNA
jgi:hypothetical protein